MRPALKISMLLSVALLLSGCDSNQYQIVTAPDGALYRFNKKTGELSVIMDNKKVARASGSTKASVIKKKDDALLEKPEDWRDVRYPGKNLKIGLQTVWREGRLCYKCSLYPYKSLARIFARKRQDYVYSLMKPGFTIELVDKNGFIVKEIKIILWHMVKARSEDGSEELVINSQTDCSRESYESIGGYTVKWFLEENLIDDEEEQYLKSSSL